MYGYVTHITIFISGQNSLKNALVEEILLVYKLFNWYAR